jgi:hypothetical protein
MKLPAYSFVTAVLFAAASMASDETAVREIDVVTPEQGASAKVVGDLRGLKPGDRLVISVQDPASGKRQMVAAEVRGTMRSEPAEEASRPVAEPAPPIEPRKTFVTSSERTVVFKEVGTAVEFVNVDPATRKVTVLGEHGQEQIFYADDKAMRSLATIQPGQKIFLSYRFNEAGRAEALVRTGRSTARKGATIQVIAADPAARTLVVRSLGGQRETLVVDEEAAADLASLKVGDIVLVGLRDDRVMAITRKR